MPLVAKAERFAGSFSTGNLTFGFGSSIQVNADAFSNYARMWNGKSSKVVLTREYSTYGVNAKIRYELDYDYFNPYLLGQTQAFLPSGAAAPNQSTNPGGTWGKVVVTIYARSTDNNNRPWVVTHETGHALSIAHPSTNTNAVMNSTPYNNNTSNSIRSYDLTTLRQIWGS